MATILNKVSTINIYLTKQYKVAERSMTIELKTDYNKTDQQQKTHYMYYKEN